MQKGKKMYLSELFLKELDEECSIACVMNALRVCDEEFRTRISSQEKERNERNVQRNAEVFEELRAFWDVYKEFDPYIEQGTKTELEIFRGVEAMLKEMDENNRTH